MRRRHGELHDAEAGCWRPTTPALTPCVEECRTGLPQDRARLRHPALSDQPPPPPPWKTNGQPGTLRLAQRKSPDQPLKDPQKHEQEAEADAAEPHPCGASRCSWPRIVLAEAAGLLEPPGSAAGRRRCGRSSRCSWCRYLVAGYDVLLKAAKNIGHGQVFDENFLMAVATIGAFSLVFFPDSRPPYGRRRGSYAVLPGGRAVPKLRRRQEPQIHRRDDGHCPRFRQRRSANGAVGAGGP